MKFLSSLPFATLATAFVLPDVQLFDKLSVQANHLKDEISSFDQNLKSSLDKYVHEAKDAFHFGSEGLKKTLEQALTEELDSVFDEEEHPGHGDHGHHGDHDHHGHHDHPDLTIYQLISKSEHTTNFTKLVNEYDDIVELLNSTKANYTLFVPTNSAFEGLPDHGDKKPPKEFIEKVLKYHIGLGLHTGKDILTTQTIATALDEELLGDEPQRLRTSVGLGGIKLNFYSKVIAANFVSLCHSIDLDA